MAIIIKDLLLNKELDQGVMDSVRGGFYFGNDDNSLSQNQNLDQTGAPTSNPPVFGGGLGINPDRPSESTAYLQRATKHSYFY